MLVIVAGTGTDVGKTWVTCRLARRFRSRGLVVAARKPAQSFDPASPGATDAELLAAATGEMVLQVCPPERSYPKAMAPPMAAAFLGRPPFSLDDLVRGTAWPAGTCAGLVELAGGLGSPQADDGDGVDLVRLFAPDLIVLVAGAGLGTLSDIALARRALGEAPMVVYLNRYDPSDDVHAANLSWLAAVKGLAVTADDGQLAELIMSDGHL